MYLDYKQILYVVDKSTRNQAEQWLKSVNTSTIWNAISVGWVDSYLGPPESIVTDAASALTSKAFQKNASILLSETQTVAVKAANRLNIV